MEIQAAPSSYTVQAASDGIDASCTDSSMFDSGLLALWLLKYF